MPRILAVVWHSSILAGIILWAAYSALALGPRITASTEQPLEKGAILDRVPCAKHPGQSYALYLPSNYSALHSWPIVYSFDPAARGSLPLQLQKEAAERYGYILAASNNSRNGSWKLEVEAADAMVTDTQTRFSIDQQRIYFAGFSGGARVAAQLAMQCRCAAGVLLSGAGFPIGRAPAQDSIFQVFSAVGTIDFNYSEMIPLQDALEKAGFPHWLRIFEGPHEWAPPEIMEESLAWFRLQAMKTQRESREARFVEAQFMKAETRAVSLEKSGDSFHAWREYLQIVSTYDSLLDVKAFRAKAESLGKEKPVRDSAKREREEFEEQARLAGEISRRFLAPQADDLPLSESDQALHTRIQLLREQAEHETRPEKVRVYQRALADVFVQAMEFGESALQEQNFQMAIRAFLCAEQVQPDSLWALRSLAVAESRAGKRKEALSTLRHAREITKEKQSFDMWLRDEAAFDRLRSSPEFDQIFKPN